jgi:hypothetical protein
MYVNEMAVNLSKTKFPVAGLIPTNLWWQWTWWWSQPNSNYWTLHPGHSNPNSRADKILSVYIDEELTFDYHTDHKKSKLIRS